MKRIGTRTHPLSVAVVMLAVAGVAGCQVLNNLLGLPGMTTGSGQIDVHRIVTSDPPNATSPITLPLSAAATLKDSLGFKWDVDPDGTVVDGGSDGFPDAFDGFMVLELRVHGFIEHEFKGDGVGAPPPFLEDGREIVIGPVDQASGGLRITRKIYIPTGQAFARWLDIFENSSDSDLLVESENRGNLGSDEDNDSVFLSSNGNTTLEAADKWWINGQQFATDPTIGAFFCGTEDLNKTQDEIAFDYGMDQLVKAHSRNILATYVFQRSPNRGDPTSLLVQENALVSDLATTLRGLETFPAVDPVFLAGMTAEEVNDLRDCGGNVVAQGGDGSVIPNSIVVVTNVTNGDTRTGGSDAGGAFGPINVKGHAGDTIQFQAGGQTFTKAVP